MDTLVPQITLVEPPPSASASDVSGAAFEKVASERSSESLVGTPSSPTNILRLAEDAVGNVSECISPRRVAILSVSDLKNSPLLLDGASVLGC